MLHRGCKGATAAAAAAATTAAAAAEVEEAAEAAAAATAAAAGQEAMGCGGGAFSRERRTGSRRIRRTGVISVLPISLSVTSLSQLSASPMPKLDARL